jgi:hypothetical protein
MIAIVITTTAAASMAGASLSPSSSCLHDDRVGAIRMTSP